MYQQSLKAFALTVSSLWTALCPDSHVVYSLTFFWVLLKSSFAGRPVLATEINTVYPSTCVPSSPALLFFLISIFHIIHLTTLTYLSSVASWECKPHEDRFFQFSFPLQSTVDGWRNMIKVEM
jgi:hypothetical protein